MKTVNIYTDGSCLGNPGPGGWCAILELEGTDYVKEFHGGFRLTTNNRMELLAAINGLDALKKPCIARVFTDSRYLSNAVGKGWLHDWRKRGWRRKDNKPLPNADLWQRLADLLKIHQTEIKWLRGHAGHAMNEKCDSLARQCASRPDLPADEMYEAARTRA